MYVSVYQEQAEFERRKAAEAAEKEYLLRKQTRLLKKNNNNNKDDEETEESENLNGKHVKVDVHSDPQIQRAEIIRMSKNINNSHLTKQQDALLRKMIAFDSLELGFGADKLKGELYKLFFVWQASVQNQRDLGL